MNLDKYLHSINEIALELAKRGEYFQEIENQYEIIGSNIHAAAKFRKSILSESDVDLASAYLPIGYFTKWDTNTRIVLFTLSLEVGRALQRLNVRSLCEEYNHKHPIFSIRPKLWEFIRKKENGEQDAELISMSPFKQIMDTELLEHDGLYFKVTSPLPPSILHWSRAQFPQAPLYVRVNPYRYSKDQIFQLNCETLTPPNPSWWQNTAIYPNQKDGFSFFLEDLLCSPETLDNFWEYNIKGIRKLQGIAKRGNGGNMSIMMEELVDRDSNEFVLGRMIHLDTDAKQGTDASKCRLNHLDLAVNYYYGDDAKNRINEDLADGGKISKASHRVHLLRIEKIPLTSIFDYVDQFFQSKIMKDEWRSSLTKLDNTQ